MTSAGYESTPPPRRPSWPWAVAAHAYMVGNSVLFGAGRYSPGTERGSRLLAHELIHVVQQGFSRNNGVLTIGAKDDDSEQQGNAIADEVGALNPAPSDKRQGMELELKRIVRGVIQRDADLDDYKQGYQDGLNGEESHAIPRYSDALTSIRRASASLRSASTRPACRSLPTRLSLRLWGRLCLSLNCW